MHEETVIDPVVEETPTAPDVVVDIKQQQKQERWKLKRKQAASTRLDLLIEDLQYDPQRFDTIATLLLSNRRFLGLLVKSVSVNVMSTLEAVKEQTKLLKQQDHLVVECFDIETHRDDEFSGERVILNWHGSTTNPVDDINTQPLKKLVSLFSEKPNGFTDVVPIGDTPSEENINLVKKMIAAILQANDGVISNERQYLLAISLNPQLEANRQQLQAEFEQRVDNALDLEEFEQSGKGNAFNG